MDGRVRGLVTRHLDAVVRERDLVRDAAVHARPQEDGLVHTLHDLAVNVPAEHDVHVRRDRELVVVRPQVRHRNHELRTGRPARVRRALPGSDRVREREPCGVRIDRTRRGRRHPEEPDPDAVDVPHRPWLGVLAREALAAHLRLVALPRLLDVRRLVAVTQFLDVRREPRMRGVRDELARHVGAVVEVVVPERVEVGADSLEERERVPAFRDQGEHAGRGVVAAPDHDGVVAVQIGEQAC